MTIKTVLKYKGENKLPNEPHTITWLEYVSLKQECENAANTRRENAAMGIKLMQQAEKIGRLRKALMDIDQARGDAQATACKALKETETTNEHLEEHFWKRDIGRGEWTPATPKDNAQFFAVMIIGCALWLWVLL